MFKAIQQECWSNFWIWYPFVINLTMWSILSKDWRIKWISNFSWIISILLDIFLKWGISKYWREMTTLDFIEMSLLILLLDLTLWDFWNKKWPKKEETQGPWMKFKIFSKSLNLNIFELLSRNYGLKISPNFAK